MKTHSQENYHICPYPDCGKRYAHEYKLKNHIASHHEKVGYFSMIGVLENLIVTPKNCTKFFNFQFCFSLSQNGPVDVSAAKYTPPSEKPAKATKPSGGAYGSASSDRPFACPYEGCEKAYIHEYKLKLHLKREHPGHSDENIAENAQANNADNEMDEASDQDAYGGKRMSNGRSQKQNKPKPNLKLPPSKISRRKASAPSSAATMKVIKKPWPVKEETYEEEDSEETEEDRDNVEDGWRYAGNNEDDDEETEYED